MPRRYSMGTRGRLTAATRTRLLDAAVQVLGEVGVDALTMQMVAERADVALRTVYNHFDSKEALVVEAYSRLAEYTQNAIRALPDEGSPRERILRFVETFCDSYEHESPGAALIMRVNDIPEFDARVTEVRAWRRREIAAIVRAAERDGSLRIPVKQAVALVFLATALATWSSLVEESKLTPTAVKQLMRTWIDTVLFGE